VTDPGVVTPPAPTQGAGWYPINENRNDQLYWDGEHWTGRRQWTGASWADVPLGNVAGAIHEGEEPVAAPDPAAGATPLPAAAVRVTTARPTRASARLNPLGPILLVMGGIGAIVGALNPWVTLTVFHFSRSISGTDHSGEGWIALGAGVILILVGVAAALASPDGRPILAVLAGTAAGGAMGISTYIWAQVGSVYGSHSSVGWGLVVVAISALVAFVAAAYVSLTVVASR
jgi:hypothetical protein